jgi:hypothetical protein
MERNGTTVPFFTFTYSFLTSPQLRFTPREDPPPLSVPIVQEAGWAPELVWTQRLEGKSSASVAEWAVYHKQIFILPCGMKVLANFARFCGLVDYFIQIQITKNLFFCCQQHERLQMILRHSTAQAVLDELRRRKASVTTCLKESVSMKLYGRPIIFISVNWQIISSQT